jgi:hypothetical protein
MDKLRRILAGDRPTEVSGAYVVAKLAALVRVDGG